MTLRKILLEMLALLLILGGLEGAYRLYKLHRYGMADYPDTLSVGYFELHPRYGIVPKKSFSSESIPLKIRAEPTLKVSFGSKYTTNTLGFRGPEISVLKPRGVYRVAVIGDSATLSIELDDEDTWPAALQTLLQEDRDFLRAHGVERVEVINASGGAWRTKEGLIRLEEEVRPLQPDMVLSALSWNDGFKGIKGIDPERVRVPRKPWVRRVKIFENLWIRFDNLKDADRGTQEKLRKKILRDSRWADSFVRNLKEMDRVCRGMGAVLLLVDLPGLCRRGAAPDSEEFRAVLSGTRVTPAGWPLWVDLKGMMSGLFQEVSHETGIPVIDVSGRFEVFTGPERVALFMDEMHASKPGAREIARAVHQALKTENR